MKRLTARDVRRLIPARSKDSHKGENGHVLLLAGSASMPGAAILSALGALQVGAGLLTVAIPAVAQKTVVARVPEAMTLLPSHIQAYVRRRTVTTLAAGPGLTTQSPIRKQVRSLLPLGLPLVLDADGLNVLSLAELEGKRVVITPHPGELARLLGTSVAAIQRDRVRIAEATAHRYSLVCILKGHETVITDGRHTFLNTTGNAAMATGGMGDVLTGVIAGLLAQGLSLWDAACAGVYLHGLAGDLAQVADRGLRASELAAHLPQALRKIGLHP